MGEKEHTPRTGTDGPRTQLMEAWTGMPEKGKWRLSMAGGALLSVTIGVPLLAEVALSLLERPALPLVVWVFCSGFAVLSMVMIFPPFGVWVVYSAAPRLSRLLPKGRLSDFLGKRHERRAPREEE